MVFPAWLDHLAELNGFSHSQTRVLAGCLYYIILIEMIVMCWIIHNAWFILYKNGKSHVLPLLTFYMLASMLIAIHLTTNLVWSFWLTLEFCP